MQKNRPLKVGLTGGIGSGKSIIAETLKVLKVPVFQSDQVAKSILVSDAEAVAEVKKHFGEEAYNGQELNRQHLADVVFQDPQKRQVLNGIVHPRVRKAFKEFCEQNGEVDYVVNEAAILIESGGYKEMDVIILVQAPLELRVSRTTDRDGVDASQVEARISAQMSDEEKLPFANFTINNDGKDPILPKVLQIHNTIIRSI